MAAPLRILLCTGNDGKFKEAVHALDSLTDGGVTAGRVTARRQAAPVVACAAGVLTTALALLAQVTRCDADPDEIQARNKRMPQPPRQASVAAR